MTLSSSWFSTSCGPSLHRPVVRILWARLSPRPFLIPEISQVPQSYVTKEPGTTTGLPPLSSAIEISHVNMEANTQWKEINQEGGTEILSSMIFCIL